MDELPAWATNHETRDGFLIGYIRERTEGVQSGKNLKDVFVERFWKDVERHYDKMRVRLLEYCKTEINVPADFESRVKSPGSIKKSIERREVDRIKKGKQPYSNLEEIRSDVHDLVGIRIIVDLTPHLEDVNNWIKETFNQDKNPIPFHADRVAGKQWTPWFGAYYCCNHHISVKTGTTEYLEPYTKVMFEIQVTCLSERLYNKLAHPLLYKGTQEDISRKDEMVIDIAHAMSLCYSMCLLYFQDFEDPKLINTMKKTVSVSESIGEEEGSRELMEQISNNTAFTPNIPLSFLTDGTSSKKIKRQDVVSLIDDVRPESMSEDVIWVQMKRIVEEATKEVNAPQLSLPEVPTARFDNKEVREAPRCHEHTRASIIQKIETWLDKPQLPETTMWISAPAGSGKSTLARTIAQRCESRDILAATYFFRRGAKDSHRNETARFFTTIANQLAANIPRFRASLRNSLTMAHVRAEDVDQKGLDIQFNVLIKNPLSDLRGNRGKPKVVVIDALDECDEATNIAEVIQRCSTLEGPADCWLRFLFTSREAGYIRTTFQTIPHQPILLHEESKEETEKDIRVYLTHNFSQIRAEKHIKGEWPHDDDLNLVVRRATTPTPLFIYASTLLRHIHNDKGTINTVAKFKNWITQCKNKRSQLGGLYAPILKDALFDNADDDEKRDLRKFLASIACTFVPLSAKTMSSLLCIDLSSIKHWLANLHPVLQVPRDENPITILHESFSDFLLDKNEFEDHQLTLGMNESHLILAEECLKRLSRGKDPYPRLSLFQGISKSQVFAFDDYQFRRDRMERLDEHVEYACYNWTDHWIRSEKLDDNTYRKMEDHLETAALPWMETMIILNGYNIVLEFIDSVREEVLIPNTRSQNRLSDMLAKLEFFLMSEAMTLTSYPFQFCYTSSLFFQQKNDISQPFCNIQAPFVRNITGDPTEWFPKHPRVIDVSKQQIFLSSEESSTFILFSNTELLRHINDIIELYDLERGILKRTYNLDYIAVAVAIHQDGRNFYSASSKGRIDLWNIESGNGKHQCMLEEDPLLERIAISTNGSFVAAASSESLENRQGNLFLWNLEDGRRFGELRCDQFPVFRVIDITVSPDSTSVAVLYAPSVVHFWDVQTKAYQKTLKLPDSADAVCFSPCGLWLLVALRFPKTVLCYSTNFCQMVPLRRFDTYGQWIHFCPRSYNIVLVRYGQLFIHGLSTLLGSTGNRSPSCCSIYAPSVIQGMALSPDHKTLATSSASSSLLFWDFETRTIRFDVSENEVSIAEAMAFSSDGKMLAVLVDNCVKLWRIHSDSQPTLVCTTQTLPVDFNPSLVQSWNPLRLLTQRSGLSFPSRSPSGDIIVKIRRGLDELSIDTHIGECVSEQWDEVKQTMSVSDEWIQYTDREGCTRNIIHIPTHLQFYSFASTGDKVVIGNFDGEFGVLDFDLEELEEYSQGLANRERLEEDSEREFTDVEGNRLDLRRQMGQS